DKTRLAASLEHELGAARVALLKAARTLLLAYLIFGSAEVRQNLLGQSTLIETKSLPPRNSRAREPERHLLLYLQRVAAKNDTFGEFGPSGWGKVDKQIRGLKIDIQPGIAAREVFLERWTAHATAAAMNADAEILVELSPRLNPNARLDDNKIIFTDTGESVEV